MSVGVWAAYCLRYWQTPSCGFHILSGRLPTTLRHPSEGRGHPFSLCFLQHPVRWSLGPWKSRSCINVSNKLPRWACLCHKACGVLGVREETGGKQREQKNPGRFSCPEVWAENLPEMWEYMRGSAQRKGIRMKLLSAMRAAYRPSRGAYTVGFSNETGNQRLLFPPPVWLAGWCFAAGKVIGDFLYLFHTFLYSSLRHVERAPLFRHSITGHLLRQVARFNNWWTGENPASLSSDLKERWNMAHNNAHMTPWRWLFSTIFHSLSLSLPLFIFF